MPEVHRNPVLRDQPRPKSGLLTFNELLELPPPRFLVEETLVEGSLALLYGHEGQGKTFLALDMALSVAAGRTWQGRETQQGPVLYVSAEGTGGLPKRVTAWIENARLDDLERTHLERNFLVWRSAVNLSSVTDSISLADTVSDALSGSPPALIVVDTLNRCFEGNENSAEDMGRFVQNVDLLRDRFPGATVLVIHHDGKSESRGPRGSTALTGAIDTSIRVQGEVDPARKPTGYGPGSKQGPRECVGYVELRCDKQKDAEPFKPECLGLFRVDTLKGSSLVVDVLDHAAQQFPSIRIEKNQSVALRTLANFGAMGARHNEWREASSLSKTTFKRVREELTKKGYIEKRGHYYVCIAEGPF